MVCINVSRAESLIPNSLSPHAIRTATSRTWPATATGFAGCRFLCSATTRNYLMLIEPAIYLAAVLADFRVAGGKVVVQNFRDLTEVMGLKEPVVVNCTGLGAKALFNDEELIPVKGQLTFLTPQPEL